LNAHENQIIGSEGRSRATFVDTITMGGSTVFDDESDDLTSEVNVLGSVLDIIEDRGASVQERPSRKRLSGVQHEVERKFEFATHGRDAAYNIGTVNGATIPGVSSDHGSFDPN
jgi:hypothetical protein